MNPPDHGKTRIDELTLANEIDRACDLFESSWKQGTRPQIAAFLSEIDESVQSAVFVELVKLDLYYRTAAGETPKLHDYTTQFPEFAEALSHLGEEAKSDLTLSMTWRQPRTRKRVAHYELRERIGQGTFGDVWTAWDNRLERLVAIKLPSERLAGATPVALFLHEARAAAKLNHANIVRVHDFGEHDERGFIVFELISGINLKRWLALRKPEVRQSAALCAQLADALDHAHRLGVVHRDLKPANVLMDDGGEPHITDFGLAKRVDVDATIAVHGEIMGTLPYMSPEQVRGRNTDVDSQADIYSVGVILYQMLVEQMPFEGDREQLMYQILNDEPKPLRSVHKAIPRDLETICLKCMAKEKSARYATAGDLRDDLHRFLKGEPILARPLSPAGRAWRWVRRNPLVAAAFGFGGCALVSAAGMMAYALTAPPLPEPGERMVTLTTVPEGAKVAFVPRDELTGEPQPEQIIHCEERTPLHQSLPPGSYLVVAYLDDGSGRFHEVYRRVPHEQEQDAGFGGPPYRHRRWKLLDDGRVEMPRIDIPAADIVHHEMALIEGDDAFPMGRDGSTLIPLHTRRVPSFYMDTKEVTVAEYRSIIADWGHDPPDRGYRPVPADWAVSLRWGKAVDRAEMLGKRLPAEAEYEYAATWGGEQDYSWETVCVREDCEELFRSRDDFGPVGTPALDRLPTDPPIVGLCSNMAEWTMTHGTAFYPSNEQAATAQFAYPEITGQRIVRGGDESVSKDGNAEVSLKTRDPRLRYSHDRSFMGPGISFRGVRSVKPRLTPTDFVQIVAD